MNCNFPARELLRMRRQLARQADKSNDPVFVRNVMEFVKACDDLRLAHVELTDCGCWYDAVREAEAVPA